MRTDLEVRQTPWAVRPEVLAPLAAVLARGEMGELPTAPQQAASGDVPTTGGVAVIPLSGLLTWRESFLSLLFGGGSGLRSFRDSFRAAVASDDVGTVLLNVDSPGGSVSQITEIAGEIRAARGTKPIISIANTQAASAAYCIACQADEMVVTPSGVVGSIGTFMVHEDWSSFNEKMGVQPTYISAGKYKVEGNPDAPLEDEARAAMQREVDDYQALFVADVAAGRGVPESTVRNGYGEGRVLTAKRALDEGLVDRVETFEQTVRRLATGSAQRTSESFIGATAPANTQHDDKPERKAPVAEDNRARIARLLAAQPTRIPEGA